MYYPIRLALHFPGVSVVPRFGQSPGFSLSTSSSVIPRPILLHSHFLQNQKFQIPFTLIRGRWCRSHRCQLTTEKFRPLTCMRFTFFPHTRPYSGPTLAASQAPRMSTFEQQTSHQHSRNNLACSPHLPLSARVQAVARATNTSRDALIGFSRIFRDGYLPRRRLPLLPSTLPTMRGGCIATEKTCRNVWDCWKEEEGAWYRNVHSYD